MAWLCTLLKLQCYIRIVFSQLQLFSRLLIKFHIALTNKLSGPAYTFGFAISWFSVVRNHPSSLTYIASAPFSTSLWLNFTLFSCFNGMLENFRILQISSCWWYCLCTVTFLFCILCCLIRYRILDCLLPSSYKWINVRLVLFSCAD